MRWRLLDWAVAAVVAVALAATVADTVGENPEPSFAAAPASSTS